MSFNKNLVVAGFTLALLIASSYGGDFPGTNDPSYGGIMDGNYCFENTGIACTSDAACNTTCLGKGSHYVRGYCFKSGSHSSCMCVKQCVAKFRHGATAAPASD